MLAGIDVGASFHYVYTGKRYLKVPAEKLDELVEKLKEENIKEVVLEPTGVYSLPVIEKLHAERIKVFIVHTKRFSDYRSQHTKAKNDKLDAKLLYKFGQENKGKRGQLFEVTDEYIQSRWMWRLWKEREGIQRALNRAMNELRDLVYLESIETVKKGDKAVLEYAESSEHLSIYAERIKLLRAQLRQVEKRMKLIVEELPSFKGMIDLLTTIPGFGWMTAYFVAMQVIDVSRFSKSEFRAFMGVGRRNVQSGISVNGLKRLKSHRTFRKLLYLAAMRLIRQPEWRRYYEYHLMRLSAGRKAIWRVVSKLVNVIYGILRTKTEYDPSKILEVLDSRLVEIASEMVRNRKRVKRYKLRSRVNLEEEVEKNAARGTRAPAEPT